MADAKKKAAAQKAADKAAAQKLAAEASSASIKEVVQMTTDQFGRDYTQSLVVAEDNIDRVLHKICQRAWE